MAKKDRVLSIGEVMQGNVSKEYLDKKEKIAVIKRRLYKLSGKRDELEDKISIVGEREDLLNEYNKVIRKMNKAQAELEELNG